jgi:hypothetical protein
MIQGRLKPKDLPPEGPANRRQRRAAAKLKPVTKSGSMGQGKTAEVVGPPEPPV